MTQSQLADRIAAHRVSVARWETGRNEPKGAGGGNEAKAGDPGTLSGAATMGEDATGTHRSAPATPAPGFEHDADKAKKK